VDVLRPERWEGGVSGRQGLEIHSARGAGRGRVGDSWGIYCVTPTDRLKFLRGPRTTSFTTPNRRLAPQAGKLATIYPRDTADCAERQELDALRGPSKAVVLSDLQLWGKGRLYLRYGGFAVKALPGGERERSCPLGGTGRAGWSGRAGSASGAAVDTSADFLEQTWPRANSVTSPTSYDIESVLTLLNGGGAFYPAASRATGERVVLKGGTAPTPAGHHRRDAQERLRHERDICGASKGLEQCLRASTTSRWASTSSCVQEFIDGYPLQRLS